MLTFGHCRFIAYNVLCSGHAAHRPEFDQVGDLIADIALTGINQPRSRFLPLETIEEHALAEEHEVDSAVPRSETGRVGDLDCVAPDA